MVDFKEFVWKGEKVLTSDGYVQNSKKLIEMTPEDLGYCYSRCKIMLYNDDKKSLGRYKILDLTNKQINSIGAELFTRYAIQLYKSNNPRLDLLNEIKTRIPNYQDKLIKDLFDNCQDEYVNIPLSCVVDSCMQTGVFTKHITKTFILKQGIWFTDEEYKNMVPYNKSDISKLDVVRDLLQLRDFEELKAKPTGLSYAQLKGMINIGTKKYSEMTTNQLETLYFIILPRFIRVLNKQIRQWEIREKIVLQAAEYLGIKL